MNAVTTTMEAGGVSYSFRLPSASEMIQVDVDALKMRGGITEGLALGIQHSQNVAMLKKLCTSPENVDFGSLPFYVVDTLGGGLWKWLNSFSQPNTGSVAGAQS